MIKHCGCSPANRIAADFQDREHGEGNHVHNEMKGEKKRYRCTVCGKVRD